MIDLTHAVVVSPGGLTGPAERAVAMLVEEAARRTQATWRRADGWPEEGTPVIAVGSAAELAAFAGPYAERLAERGSTAAEGYRILTEAGSGSPAVVIAGNDARGVLYGVGHLLRTLRMERQRALLPQPLNVETAPHYALRGHQLGYRQKTNSYDGWDLRLWEQYIRDLAVFGANAIELIPPRSDDDADSPHFPLPPMPMMVGMSRLLDEYGLDVWIWYPAMDPDYGDPAAVDGALQEWGEVFGRLPRVDAVFVPGGDPGHTRPADLLVLLERQTENLRRYHPKAQMWVSPQGFHKAWMDEFLALLAAEPLWLSGVVYGPQVRVPLAELRAAVPKRYPLRHYPDITHSFRCQYPVPDWDTAFAATEGRECVNPRPVAQARIFHRTQPETVGFLTYSEGCNDDVNKMVWSALGWDPERDVTEILREYTRYFIGPACEEGFAQGLLALERNWEGPALANRSIETTLEQFREMERAAGPPQLLNWRFQQALYRAYYDAYVRSRLLYETHLEDRARACLRAARRTGALAALAQAEAILDQAVTEPVSADLRARLFELGEAVFQSVRMQLSVERYAAEDGRGNTLDTLDVPVNERLWLKARFAEIRVAPEEPERLRRIDALLHRASPGPGGFYDDLGAPLRQPHLVRGPGAVEDPQFFRSALTLFDYRPQAPRSWWNHAVALYDQPLRMRYTDLDREAAYRLRVVYAGGPIRLTAGGQEVHPLLTRTYEPLEFALPAEATVSGTLELAWYSEEGRGGAGRGCQVAEVWLIRE